MPELETHRFLTKIRPPEDLQAATADLIYEAMPALYHYNGAALSRIIPELGGTVETSETGEVNNV